MVKKYWIGFLILVILSTSVYILLPEKVRVDVQKTRTQYRVGEDEWILSATEYVNLFDGSAKMRAKNRRLYWYNADGIITISREANYKDNISTYETYIFDSTKLNVELVPISHEIICINCIGKILHFEYRDILYEGETKDITSPFSFGHNMKLTWQEGAYRAKVYQQKYASDKIIIRYRPKFDYESFFVRLFDPILKEGGVMIGTKIVKDVCTPVYKTWTDKIKHYKTCERCYNITIKINESWDNFSLYVNPILNKSDGSYYIIKEECYDYTCLDYIEEIPHINEQVDCFKIGVMNVSGKIVQEDKRWCELEGDEICCMSNIDGGRYGAWFRTDGSVDKTCTKVKDI